MKIVITLNITKTDEPCTPNQIILYETPYIACPVLCFNLSPAVNKNWHIYNYHAELEILYTHLFIANDWHKDKKNTPTFVHAIASYWLLRDSKVQEFYNSQIPRAHVLGGVNGKYYVIIINLAYNHNHTTNITTYNKTTIIQHVHAD